MYRLLSDIRNLLFDKGILKARRFDGVFVLCVGNLRVGGTGKTPMVEYLVANLCSQIETAVVSLGYKRKTKGIREIGPEDSYEDVGDEPRQMSNKFPNVHFFVGKDRNHVIELILEKYPSTRLIVLDDGFQYRKTLATKNILLTEYARPFYNDRCLPWGRLRESKKGKNRADYIVVTKSPLKTDKDERQAIVSKIAPLERQKIFFSSIVYNKDIEAELKDRQVVLLCAIDNPLPLKKHLQTFCTVQSVLKFRDHHSFSDKEIEKIEQTKYPVVCTEKDSVRLQRCKAELYVQTIRIETDESFINTIKDDIRKYFTNKGLYPLSHR